MREKFANRLQLIEEAKNDAQSFAFFSPSFSCPRKKEEKFAHCFRRRLKSWNVVVLILISSEDKKGMNFFSFGRRHSEDKVK